MGKHIVTVVKEYHKVTCESGVPIDFLMDYWSDECTCTPVYEEISKERLFA